MQVRDHSRCHNNVCVYIYTTVTSGVTFVLVLCFYFYNNIILISWSQMLRHTGRGLLETDIWRYQGSRAELRSWWRQLTPRHVAVVNYTRAYKGKIILLIVMGITHDLTASHCQSNSGFLLLHLRRLHPRTKSWTDVLMDKCLCSLCEITIVHHHVEQ